MPDSAANFSKLVPGFDFLQGLVQNAGAALPNIGQWVAPTLNPEELEKRIEELRTVQFWLEQNARMLGATIQALEVQRMTLSTLKTMNVQMEDLRESMKIRLPASDTPAPAPAVKKASAASAAPSPAAAGVADPMQWWSALTKQFTQLAAGAMNEGAAEAKNLTSGAVQQSLDAIAQGLRQPGAGAKAPREPADAPRKPARKRAGKTG